MNNLVHIFISPINWLTSPFIVYLDSSSICVANCVLFFFIGNRLQQMVATDCYYFSSFLIIQSTATGTQQLDSSYHVVISSEAAQLKFTHITKCDVHHSQWDHSTSSPISPSVMFTILSETIQQVHPYHQEWCSPFSVRPFNKFTHIAKCDVHHSQWDHSTSSPISPSVMFTILSETIQ